MQTASPRRALLSWAMYDWANSAFATVIQTFIFAAYFTRSVASNPASGSAHWGNVVGAAGLVIGLGGPILGAMADQGGSRKPWLAAFTLLCVCATAGLWSIGPGESRLWLAMGLVFLGTVGSEYALIFYNAMLPSLASSARLGRWSGWGWALGYAGGLLCLVIALMGFIGDSPWFALDRSQALHVRATFVLAAGWYLVFALPLLLFTPDTPSTGKTLAQAARSGLGQLRDSLRHARRYGHILRFLIARMIYNDGLATTFAFGGIFAAGAFGMDEKEVLLFGIALNVTAGLGAFGFAWVDDRIGARQAILVSLVGLLIPSTAMLMVESKGAFWALGLVLGVFVGPVQASSRSYLARVAPPEVRNQMFGLYALSGKLTSFAGPLLVGWVSYLSGSQRWGMAIIPTLFLLGGLLLLGVPRALDAAE